MAAGRNCFILSFPYVFTIAALVLSIFVIIGNLQDHGILSKLYFMRLNTQDLSITVESTTIAATAIDPSFPDFYQVGLWNYCQGTISGDVYTVTNCTTPHGLFYFNPISVIEERLGISEIQNVPSQVDDALNAVRVVSYVMIILYCVSAIFAAMEFIAGFFSFHSRGGSFCTLIISLLALACIVVSTALATALYYVEARAFNDANSTLGTTASTNTTTFGIAWGAAAAAILATIFWFFSICCGSTRSSRKNEVIYRPVDNPGMSQI
ncbi:actin cortical patch SUR7/pH-response regulator pali [Lipomyces tetrasporus]|uniref:Actin cortical patch SUR7/pH-response regulator pali n=1 Tax=Lipomyces tetrasporus TaxID=54092 RepID=A0AAD7QWE0_9ASCO|nr:actin cortical patch SUR7/pH-response regulator pali [Lipomyces tetrasporus]KAJ8102755.1 actin cortical patch SUR7/pH-response regulator pali [Lipomyces tetrasporus]